MTIFSAFGDISVLQASNRIFSDAYTCGADVMQIIGTGPVVQLSLVTWQVIFLFGFFFAWSRNVHVFH